MNHDDEHEIVIETPDGQTNDVREDLIALLGSKEAAEELLNVMEYTAHEGRMVLHVEYEIVQTALELLQHFDTETVVGLLVLMYKVKKQRVWCTLYRAGISGAETLRSNGIDPNACGDD